MQLDFGKTLLLSLSYDYLSPFFSQFEIWAYGMQKQHFSFHLAQTAPIVVRYTFVLQKIMDYSTGKRERRTFLLQFLLKSSQALAEKHDRTFLSFTTADLNNAQQCIIMLNSGSYLMLAQIFHALAKMGLALARIGGGRGGGVPCDAGKKMRCIIMFQK